MRRVVGAQFDVDISAPTTLELQMAVAPHPNAQVFRVIVVRLERKAHQANGDQRRARQPDTQI